MTILDRIIETKRAEVARAKIERPIERIIEAARDAKPPRDFLTAVTRRSTRGPNLIAEIKRKSPSAGVIRERFDPVEIARVYEHHGAVAISVLTDETHFDGRLDFIAGVQEAVALPVLRKEFVIDEYQVYESRAAAADAMLLIVEAIGIERVAEFAGLTVELGMTCLIEVHSEENLLALLDSLGPPVTQIDASRRLKPAAQVPYILGINNRDLSSQGTDISTTARLAKHLPEGAAFISESGLGTRSDVQAVFNVGACAILVGESLLKEDDIGRKIDELLGAWK